MVNPPYYDFFWQFIFGAGSWFGLMFLAGLGVAFLRAWDYSGLPIAIVLFGAAVSYGSLGMQPQAWAAGIIGFFYLVHFLSRPIPSSRRRKLVARL